LGSSSRPRATSNAPPAASASYVLPRVLFEKDATVGQVVDAIVSALERKGYVERSFFRTGAGGVALVKQPTDDGTAQRPF